MGFVVDDVGRHGASAWDALVEEVSQRSGILLLGTVRELDLHDLHSVTSLQIVRPSLDERLAEDLWEVLRTSGETSWKAWREPFEAAGGLVLEYTALLTVGERLERVLEGQIRTLASGEDSGLLTVLAIVVVADLLELRYRLHRRRGRPRWMNHKYGCSSPDCAMSS